MINYLTTYNNVNSINKISSILFILLGIISLYIIFFSKTKISKKTKKGKKVTVQAEKEFSSKFYIITFSLIALVGLIVRIVQLGNVPGGVNYDEAMAAIDANAIAHHGTDHWGMSFPVQMQAWKRAQQSAFVSYFLAPFIRVFGMNLLTIRIPMLLLSCAGACCFVLLMKDLYGKNCALITAFLVAISPWHFLQSRWMLEANFLPHMFIIAAYVLNKGLRNKKLLYLSMALFGISMYTYTLAIYCVPLFLCVFAIYMLVSKRTDVKTVLISFAIYFVISFPFFLCMLINLMKWDTIQIGIFTIPRFYETQRASDIIFFVQEPLKQLVSNIKTFYETVIVQKTTLPQNAIDGFGLHYMCSLPLTVLGIIQLFRVKNPVGKTMIITMVSMGFVMALLTPASTSWRIAVMNYAVIALDALGLYLIFGAVKRIGLVAIVSYTMLFSMLVATYFTGYADTMKRYYFGGFGDALKYMYTLDADKYYVTSESQFKTSKDVSEVFTLFYHDIDAEYFQGKTNGDHDLPYTEKYIYSNITPEQIIESENAVYLITTDERKYFDESKYDFQHYNGWQIHYLVVTKKK